MAQNLREGGEVNVKVKVKQDGEVSTSVTNHSNAEKSCQQQTELSIPLLSIHENCFLRICSHIVI
jgi:hypothetical protein